jgi:hypothetical protein
MSKITKKELVEIQKCISNYKKSGECKDLVQYASQMHDIITSIRGKVHFTEDAEGFCLDVAQTLGTNCCSDKDIDETE